MWPAMLCCVVQVLGLDEGHAVCQALQDVKLAVNAGSYSQLESASGAVAVCVLADWFEGFTDVSRVQGHGGNIARSSTEVADGLPGVLSTLLGGLGFSNVWFMIWLNPFTTPFDRLGRYHASFSASSLPVAQGLGLTAPMATLFEGLSNHRVGSSSSPLLNSTL